MMDQENLRQNQPAVTVIMPAYQSRDYIEAAVRSVMAQTMPDWELIVLDDCSGDDTPEIVQSLAREDNRVRLVRNQENMGVARTRNKGLDMARGKFIALLDSDDVWFPEKLERQLALMEETGADICYCSYAIVDRENKRRCGDFLVPECTDYGASLVQSVISCSTVLLRRETAGHYRFSEAFYHEDLALWLQMLGDGCRAVGVREVLAGYRIVAGSRASNKLKTVLNRWRVYRGLGISRGRSAMLLGRYAVLALRKYSAPATDPIPKDDEMKTYTRPAEWDHRAHQMAVYSLLEAFDQVCRTLEIPYVIFAGTLLGAVRHQGFIPWDDDLDVMMLREDYERFLREAEGVLDREKFFLQKEFSEHWPMFFSKLRLNGTTCLEKFHPRDPEMHQGVYMDIFPCDNALSSGLGRKIQYLCSKVVIAKSLDRRGYDTRSLSKKVFMGLCRLMPMRPFLAVTKMGGKKSPMVHSFLGGAHGFAKNIYPRPKFTPRCWVHFQDRSYPAPEDYDSLLKQLYGDYLRIPAPEERAVKQHALLVDLENSYENYRHYRDNMEFDVLTRSIR